MSHVPEKVILLTGWSQLKLGPHTSKRSDKNLLSGSERTGSHSCWAGPSLNRSGAWAVQLYSERFGSVRFVGSQPTLSNFFFTEFPRQRCFLSVNAQDVSDLLALISFWPLLMN